MCESLAKPICVHVFTPCCLRLKGPAGVSARAQVTTKWMSQHARSHGGVTKRCAEPASQRLTSLDVRWELVLTRREGACRVLPPAGMAIENHWARWGCLFGGHLSSIVECPLESVVLCQVLCRRRRRPGWVSGTLGGGRLTGKSQFVSDN